MKGSNAGVQRSNEENGAMPSNQLKKGVWRLRKRQKTPGQKIQSPVLLSRPELTIRLAVSGASGPAGVQPTLPALRPLEAQPLRAGSCCDQLPAPPGRVNSVRDAVEVGPLLPGTEGPPPFCGFLAAVPGCPNVAGSLALSLSRLGRVAPRSTLCQSSHELAGSGLVVWATWAEVKPGAAPRSR